ncbi:uncharacterized protein ASPGLDRAFT_1282282 [Aspergillus glaucus CBS 516.65]|uniref:Uncharacterized protein n=1 Tax=Aspergillus glaucus CBS 516.65 TaxID=1160497 RepID=A0A1L9V3P5_ASPGL|nr:hypothetical protein ASPGLDRAFT_1282282 [Aspergillus glaucus CBS 516.65]OJJ78452.1 hypothetical protein ASPGLDRAFT_1282282 [Aspergillus glaucus CBS 516.65]
MLLEQGDSVYMIQPHHEQRTTYINTGYLAAASMDEKPADKPGIPLQYIDYVHVFSEHEAGILASHGDHDHAIELELDKPPPLKPIYPLSQNELGVSRRCPDSLCTQEGWQSPPMCGLLGSKFDHHQKLLSNSSHQ